MPTPTQLAILLPLPSGGINSPPEIPFSIVETKGNPRGDQLIAEAVQLAAVTVTSALLLALKGADVQLVPAPPLGYAIDVIDISLRINFGGTAYTLNAGTLIPYLGPSANGVPLTADLSAILTQGATSDNIGIPALATGVKTQALTEAQGVFLGNQGAAQYTLGNGTLDVVISYLVQQM